MERSDADSRVIGLSRLHDELVSPRLIPIAAYDTALLGTVWNGANFVPTIGPGLTLVVTRIEADPDHASQALIADDLAEVTCPVGTHLTVTGELRDGNDQIVGLTERFRMPIRADDGRERVLLASLDNGTSTIVAPMRESGVWRVTEEAVNSTLPPTMKMSFAGVTVYVFEVV